MGLEKLERRQAVLGKSTTCLNWCAYPECWGLISAAVIVRKVPVLDEGLWWAPIAAFYFTDVIKRHSSNLFIPLVLLFQMGITGQDSVKSASMLLNRKELQ